MIVHTNKLSIVQNLCTCAHLKVSPCCSGRSDHLMDEIPTVVVDPLPAGVDQVEALQVDECDG